LEKRADPSRLTHASNEEGSFMQPRASTLIRRSRRDFTAPGRAAAVALAGGLFFADLPAQAQGQSQRKPAAEQSGVRVADIAGRYIFLREEGSDTGCMVTLHQQPRGRGAYRAQLAPACRDNGLVIFDPVRWSVDRGRIALQARKGHRILFERDASGDWRRSDQTKARPLSLRRI